MLYFASDYMEGAHPLVLKALADTNLMHSPGYGTDPFCESAREKIRTACGAAEAAVHFLAGGTQANAVVISSVLRPYQGVIAADSGHISQHEAGAIEYTGHKVLTVPGYDGKLSAADVDRLCSTFYNDDNHDHMVMPGMVYISHPTESGTLYTLDELKELRSVCDRYALPLYLDGARLAYALACPGNELTLKDIAAMCDVFYIGGTKCGALYGEAVVVPDPELIPHFFTMIKQHGALMAKGRILGVQFDTLFTDGLYLRIGKSAIENADLIRNALTEKGYSLCFSSPTNQVFPVFEDNKLAQLQDKVMYSFWEKYDDEHTIIRFATSWATTAEDTQALTRLL
ncbi:MAG: aminotransferase class V-fold PLP-dependent enzyme [Lachnospiraceae bacterium]|nr:aminotransferase class V-fold PLP-dependent enzyme [Lachnospiraceae bacterium]